MTSDYNGSRIGSTSTAQNNLRPSSTHSFPEFQHESDFLNSDSESLAQDTISEHFGTIPSQDFYENYRKNSNGPSAHYDAYSASAASAGPADVSDTKYRFGSRIFLFISVVSALLVLGLEGFMFGALTRHRRTFVTDQRYYQMAIYLALFIFAGFYQVFLTIVGLKTKNMLLLAMLGVFYACMLIYTGIQYHEVTQNVDMTQDPSWRLAVHATNIATIGVLALTVVVQSLIIYFILWRSVRWFTFKKIGASFEIKRLYSYFQFHRNLLVFDFFFFVGFTVQFIVIMVENKRSREFILTCCMLPLTILVLFLSDFAASRELMWLTFFTTACFLAGGVYVIFKIVRLYTKYTSAYNVAMRPGDYFPGRTALVMFGVITLLFLILTIAMEMVMVYGYNRGLLPYVNKSYSKDEKEEEDVID